LTSAIHSAALTTGEFIVVNVLALLSTLLAALLSTLLSTSLLSTLLTRTSR
jgi:hypothetical protein